MPSSSSSNCSDSFKNIYIYQVKVFYSTTNFNPLFRVFSLLLSTFIAYRILIFVNYAHEGGVGEFHNCHKINECCLKDVSCSLEILKNVILRRVDIAHPT